MAQNADTQDEFEKMVALQDVVLQAQRARIAVNALTATFAKDPVLAEAIAPGHHQRVRDVINTTAPKP